MAGRRFDRRADGRHGRHGSAGREGRHRRHGRDWLAGSDRLTGATGSQGPIGLTGATGATGSQGPIGLTGATGSQGPAGANGTNGTNGADGKTILNGTAVSRRHQHGVNGDFYIDTSTNTMYGPKAAAVAGRRLDRQGGRSCRVRRAPGSYRCSGPRGAQGPIAMGTPRSAGSRGPAGERGSPGAPGATPRHRRNAPTAPTARRFSTGRLCSRDTTGVNGDYYVDTSTNTMYGPKAAAAGRPASL